MSVKTQIVLKLLTELSEKADAGLHHGGFGVMEEYLENSITQKYLDDTYRLVRKALDAKKKEIGSKRSKLDEIAKGIGYRNFHEFEIHVNRPVDPILYNCVGNWWSLVRANTGETIFKAPVKIKINQDNHPVMILKGKEHKFTGTIIVSAGCLFCNLDSHSNKKLHIILKGNVNAHAQTLQGIFSAISSTGDPIGGRELFVRENKLKYDEMKWCEIPLSSPDLQPWISSYFNNKFENCIKINNNANLG